MCNFNIFKESQLVSSRKKKKIDFDYGVMHLQIQYTPNFDQKELLSRNLSLYKKQQLNSLFHGF